MGLESIFLPDHLVAVHNIADLVTRDQIFMIVAPHHCLHSIRVNVTTAQILQVLCIPRNDLSLTRRGHTFLAVLHPLDLVHGFLMLVLTLSQISGACNSVKIGVKGLATRIGFRTV